MANLTQQEIHEILEHQELMDAEELFYEMQDDPEAAFYYKHRERIER
jgi:hypothetical protein